MYLHIAPWPQELRWVTCPTPLGSVAAAFNHDALCRFTWLNTEPTQPIDTADTATCKVLLDLLAHPERGWPGRLWLSGTAFQIRVWEALTTVPAGQTLSYQALAQRIGQANACRAVANACAANPLPVAIPCHRVIHKSGDLGGYRWGLARKRALLQREGVVTVHKP
ncbi:MAG: methylated-DNA--[protein]-cysteine S-methyltransferase [Methylococcales bacterium]|nr:methylated-DNA--[protein]-cysteine S-methyltransferase [Methylococcales bacterium]